MGNVVRGAAQCGWRRAASRGRHTAARRVEGIGWSGRHGGVGQGRSAAGTCGWGVVPRVITQSVR